MSAILPSHGAPLVLAVHRAEQDGDGPRVVGEPVAGADEDPQLGLPGPRRQSGPGRR